MDKYLQEEITKFLISTTDKDSVSTNEPMSVHTTFKTGGNASVFVRPSTIEQICSIIKYLNENNINYFVMGNGSNLLVSDSGFDGVIIQLLDNFCHIGIVENTDDYLYAEAFAGARMWKIGMFLADEGGSGFEFATGIPGTIGGAVMMNAGAYGGEIKDVVSEVRVCDNEGNIFTLSAKELDFGYRRSIISDKNYIVLSCILKLKKGNPQEIRLKIDDFTERRKSKQPLEYASAGSTFKRPEGYFAGKLIEDAGLKGFQVGDAAVSEKHSGFVINKGSATSEDIIKLTDIIKEKVFEKSGVRLELEVRKLGF